MGSSLLWNLILDSLLNYTLGKIPCDVQGFADDIALLATLKTPRSGGHRGFDADTLREATQKSLNAGSEWCKDSGVRISI